jgi:hypothetical protein
MSIQVRRFLIGFSRSFAARLPTFFVDCMASCMHTSEHDPNVRQRARHRTHTYIHTMTLHVCHTYNVIHTSPCS